MIFQAEPLRDLAPEDRQEVTLMLYRSVLFGPSTPQLSSSKDMQAFKDGFNVQLSDNVSLIQVCSVFLSLNVLTNNGPRSQLVQVARRFLVRCITIASVNLMS